MDGMCSVAQLVERLLVKPKIPGLNLQDFRFWSFLFWDLRFTLFNPSQLFFDEKIFNFEIGKILIRRTNEELKEKVQKLVIAAAAVNVVDDDATAAAWPTKGVTYL